MPSFVRIKRSRSLAVLSCVIATLLWSTFAPGSVDLVLPSVAAFTIVPRDGSSFARSQSINVFSSDKQSRSIPRKRSNRHNNNHDTPTSRRGQLVWIAQSIQKMNYNHSLPFSQHTNQKLVDDMFRLAEAKTPAQISQVGRDLQALPLVSASTSVDVLERLIKATALTGLHLLSWNYTVTGFLDQHRIPHPMAQDALCNSLRKAGKITRLECFLRRMGEISDHSSSSSTHAMSTVAFNIYLAALCQEDGRRQSPKGTIAPSRLDQAFRTLTGKSAIRAVPNAVSYATVLQAAATARNRTLSDAVWTRMQQEQQQHPVNIMAYNARLNVLLHTGTPATRHDQALELWDRELMSKSSGVEIDQYTLDLMLLPLSSNGRQSELENVLNRWISSNSDKVTCRAFSVFLLTLIRGGRFDAAQDLFQRYVLPSFLPVIAADAGMLHIVKPSVQQFNVMLEGYRKEIQSYPPTEMNSFEASALYDNALQLFDKMKKWSSIRPDAYTITTMIGICRTSEELSILLNETISSLEIPISDAIFRAATTRYGSLKDPASACWFFDTFGGDKLDLRSLNVLMGTFVNSAEAGDLEKLDLMDSVASLKLADHVPIHRPHNSTIRELVDGRSCTKAALTLLSAMSEGRTAPGVVLPMPNSQTYCVASSALQYLPTNAKFALSVFRNATEAGVPADGRFVNAVFRCFGDDISAALLAWKTKIRPACLAYETRDRNKATTSRRMEGKNLFAAYNGLLHVCGRALRPDIALRLIYAMNKEGIEPTELSLNCYRSGKRTRKSVGRIRELAQKLKLIDPYESLLLIECTKYDQNDKRRAGEKRVRIIV